MDGERSSGWGAVKRLSRIVTFAQALPLLLTLLSPALAAGYAGLEGEAVYYLTLNGKPDKLSGMLEVVYAVSIPRIALRTRTYRVQGSERANVLTLNLDGKRWTAERTRAGLTLKLPKTSSISLTVNLETATRAEFGELVNGFKTGVEQRARAVPTG